MNYSSAVMLINENIRAVHVVYEPDQEGKVLQTRYTFKTLDKTIQPGDLVVAPTDTRHNFTVVKVVAVDVEVDFESSVQLKWLAGKVDLTEYEAVVAKESEWIDVLKQSEKRRKREEIKKNMFDIYEDTEFNKLAIANMTNATTTTGVMLEAQEEATTSKS